VERARAVVIGGGVTGCSILLHLAEAGWTDVVLLEKGELTSGSTHHAAGLVTMYNPSPTMMRFRRYSIERYSRLGVFETVGSLRFASSRNQLLELRRGVSRARGIGLDLELLSPDDARELMPAASPEGLTGAVYVPGDGYLDPHGATHALAGAARALGASVRTNVRVTGIELSRRREVTAVRTDQGRIETEVVVNAAGIWAPRVASMVGAFCPSTPVDHQHVALKAVAGSELPGGMPCFRDPDNLVYGKAEAGGILFGGYEPDPVARWIDGVPWEHGGRSLPPAMDRFEQLMRSAARRFPFVSDAEIVKLVCHPDAMTPDANPLLGPVPGVRGFYMAAGLSLNGFGAAGGIGKTIAEWVTDGEPELDILAYRAWRFGDIYRDASWAAEVARETYRYYYELRYPFDQDELGRPKRESALMSRMQDAGAVFGAKNGWERVEYVTPGEPWRRAGADQRAWGWTEPPFNAKVAQEHRAVRTRAGLFDMSSFGKIEVAGPDALSVLERVSDNLVDRPVGRVVYTQFLDRRGGIVADVTITRLADDRFRVITGSGTIDADLGWIRANTGDGEDVELRDVTEELAVVGLWGPSAAAILGSVSEDDLSDHGFPFMQARPIDVRGVPVFAQRVTYVGEPGWELYVQPEWATQVWDRLTEAGEPHGVAVAGYRALDSLRMEKGYRYFGIDLTMLDDPFEVGLAACVRLDKQRFVGRGALVSKLDAGPPARRLRTLLVGGEAYVPIYGGEAVSSGADVVGRLRSCAYGFTVGRNIAYALLPHELAPGRVVDVDVFGEPVPAEVTDDAVLGPSPSRTGR
jgi:glycine cleavage system aminomethyltransferase T/glycine/D-amino acid oxidase-like deaminating enzyme